MFIGNQRAAHCGKGKAKVIRAFLSRKELSPVHLTNTEKQTDCQNVCFFSYFWKDITGIAEKVERNSCKICI